VSARDDDRRSLRSRRSAFRTEASCCRAGRPALSSIGWGLSSPRTGYGTPVRVSQGAAVPVPAWPWEASLPLPLSISNVREASSGAAPEGGDHVGGPEKPAGSARVAEFSTKLLSRPSGPWYSRGAHARRNASVSVLPIVSFSLYLEMLPAKIP
jgi:hypothetical protein